MRYLWIFFLLLGCSEYSESYFPLDKIKSYYYKVEIQPEVEKKTIYKKVNLSLGKKRLDINGEKISIYPFLREDGSLFFYKKEDDGVYREGLAFARDDEINAEKKKGWFSHFPSIKEKNGLWKVKLS